ncbi:GntR family transcriptional regulator [Salinicoccus albus]|uniref:GntR family transcriptional regulator n=1 Tax=Salinicoccus albus TaxID=418756 RepID=UPI00037D908C|nr:GntR family transcriptional regulator [Salinicoccus albus]
MEKENYNFRDDEALYLQVKDILVARIQKGIWAPDTLIPTEQALINEFRVSRTTIRQAINILVQNEMLKKTQGRGTIVKPQNLLGSLGRLKGFAEEVRSKGQVPHSRLIRSEFRATLYQEKTELNVSQAEEILLIERIRFADDVPIAIEKTSWPKDIGELLIRHDLNQVNYYDVLEAHNIYLKNAQENIRAINATIEEADLLGIRPGEALLEMTRLSFGMNDHPIEFTKTKYRSDKYQYSIDLKR